MDFFYDDFDACLDKTIDSLKLLLYRRHNDIFERLDFDNQEIYQDPLLFAYVTQKDNKWLDCLIYGYEKTAKEKIAVFTNKEGIIYISKIGYFKTNVLESELTLVNIEDKFTLIDSDNNKINYDFEPIFYLKEQIELVKTIHPLQECMFVNNEGKIVNVETNNLFTKHIDHFNNALDIIKKYYSDYFKLLKKNVKKVMMYCGEPYSFASIQCHNMIFLNVNNEDDEIFFLDHILHEGSHVVFNTLTYDTKLDLFTIPFKSPISDFTKNPQDHGEVYGRFHGMFTQSNINICFENCIKNNVFNERQLHELLGRFSSNMKRFNASVEKFNLPHLYKSEGLKWYTFFSSRCDELTERNRKTIYSLDVSNQPYVFSYKVFNKTNLMKLSILIFFLLSLNITAQEIKESYPQRVGDINFDPLIDDQSFKICDEKQTAQYYNFSKGFHYKGEKYEIIKIFKEKYHPGMIGDKEGGTGYITIRFLVNCEGKTGLFRVQEMNLNYLPAKFDESIKSQLLEITKSLDGWLVGEYDGKNFDYYQYLTFKLDNYKLLEILP
jgi:hypothetical protein